MALIHGTWELQTVGRHPTGPSFPKLIHWGWVLSSDLTLESCAFLENSSLLFSVPPWVYLLSNKLGRHRKTHHEAKSPPPHPSFFFLEYRFCSKVKVKVAQSCPTLCNSMDYTVHGILQARILEWVAFPFSRGSSQPRDLTRSPTLQVDSLPAEPQGKPKNTREGSLCFLQLIFPT